MVVDRRAKNEIVLYIENDSTLYRQQYKPIVLNLARKKVAGTYDPARAPTLVMYLVDNGIKKYRREFGEGGAREYGLGTRQVSKETKLSAAREILAGMREDIEDAVYELKKKKAAKKATKKKK